MSTGQRRGWRRRHDGPRPFYGEGPTKIADLDLSADWHEFMHYLYLPVRIPATDPGVNPPNWGQTAIPRPLAFLAPAISRAITDAQMTAPHLADPYVYVTARRGFASPGNPLNRPGFHTDDFGGTDLNYIWTDRFPTRFVLSDDPLPISDDDDQSMIDMARYADIAADLTEDWQAKRQFNGNAERPRLRIEHGPTNALLRLTPHVIHATPEIAGSGGMRSFFKISASNQRYDLLGNSHNYDLDYEWPMVERRKDRNQPQGDRMVVA